MKLTVLKHANREVLISMKTMIPKNFFLNVFAEGLVVTTHWKGIFCQSEGKIKN